ncbi:hypothetical protein MKW94_012989 [Papaver nudicaule]|uniref:Uncharacterized protein n=1 Tax=Papaver nudicaule TaxID=74823 RepID=A0AA41SEP5_PAPNU|nr:hypothetical protein [Papaver nudicaule]
MATGWVKSLQCKSRAFEDVYVPNNHSSNSKPNLNHLLSSSSCRKNIQNLKDVVETNNSKKKPKNKYSAYPKHSTSSSRSSSYQSSRSSTKSDQPISSKTASSTNRVHHHLSRNGGGTGGMTRSSDPFFPTLTELTETHPSRNVVEIIFHTSWSPKAFSGRIEMIFKVQNLPKTVARFEEYREIVKSRAVSGSPAGVIIKEEDDHVRCMADGNEMMRFHCLGPTAGAIYEAGGLCTNFPGKDSGICTFSGSGGAHENAGGGKGTRAMLVCRVIAGRVCKRLGVESFMDKRAEFDSFSGGLDRNGKLLVFDSRAVLPCFLIIYKL